VISLRPQLSSCPRVAFSDQSEPSTSASPGGKELQSVCATVGSAVANREQLELHIDQHRRLWESAHRSAILAQEVEDVTLELMLAATSKFAQSLWLKKQKALLALKLAYSLLYLWESVWSRSYWSRRCIFFMRDRAAQSASIDMAQPYVPTQLFPLNMQHVAGSHSGDMSTKHTVPHLLALGVLLLELQMHGPIMDSCDLSNSDIRDTAINVLLELSDEGVMSKYYEAAIVSCLLLSGTGGIWRSLEDYDFRSWYCQEVITQLTDYITTSFDVTDSDLAKS
jgi:hypothetical protein